MPGCAEYITIRSSQSGVDNLDVVVEQQQVLALAAHGADVDLGREVEGPVELDEAEPVAADLVQGVADVRRRVGVGTTDDLVVLVGRALDDAADAVLDQHDGS